MCPRPRQSARTRPRSPSPWGYQPPVPMYNPPPAPGTFGLSHSCGISPVAGIMDPYTQAFKNALTVSFLSNTRTPSNVLQGWGGTPYVTDAVPDIPESQIGMRLEPKCIDMRYDGISQSFVAEERETPLPVPPGWAGPVSSDPYADYAFTLHRTSPIICSYKAYFDVRSPHLRRMFESIIGKVEGISWTARPLRVSQLLKLHDHTVF